MPLELLYATIRHSDSSSQIWEQSRKPWPSYVLQLAWVFSEPSLLCRPEDLGHDEQASLLPSRHHWYFRADASPAQKETLCAQWQCLEEDGFDVEVSNAPSNLPPTVIEKGVALVCLVFEVRNGNNFSPLLFLSHCGLYYNKALLYRCSSLPPSVSFIQPLVSSFPYAGIPCCILITSWQSHLCSLRRTSITGLWHNPVRILSFH